MRGWLLLRGREWVGWVVGKGVYILEESGRGECTEYVYHEIATVKSSNDNDLYPPNNLLSPLVTTS